MNIHKNAQLTPHRRGELVGHIGAGERAASANGPRVWIKLKPGCARRGPTPEAVVWRLSERAGARDGAATVVGPVSRDMPVWGGVHENPRSCASDPATICSWADCVRYIGWLGCATDVMRTANRRW